MQETKKFWSKYGVILGIILVVVNIACSMLIYNDPDIRHPHELSDLKIIAYPNALLGAPAVLVSWTITPAIISNFYRPQQYSQIPDDDATNMRIAESNSKLIDKRHSVSLFVDIFIVLSLYWFIVGVFVTWLYRRISKIGKISLSVILLVILLGTAMVTLTSL